MGRGAFCEVALLKGLHGLIFLRLGQVNRLFLPVSWSSFPTSDDSNLLLKLLPDHMKGGLSLMATDLENVYFESLSRRQLTRRIDDALSSAADTQSQSQSVFVGIGEDGEKLLQESVDKLLSAVTTGTAKADITHEAFEASPVASAALPSPSLSLTRYARDSTSLASL